MFSAISDIRFGNNSTSSPVFFSCHFLCIHQGLSRMYLDFRLVCQLAEKQSYDLNQRDQTRACFSFCTGYNKLNISLNLCRIPKSYFYGFFVWILALQGPRRKWISVYVFSLFFQSGLKSLKCSSRFSDWRHARPGVHSKIALMAKLGKSECTGGMFKAANTDRRLIFIPLVFVFTKKPV